MIQDQNYKRCPQQHEDYIWWGPLMMIPREGRTDIVRCWQCGHEEPRFQEVEEEPVKKHKGSRNNLDCSCDDGYDWECPRHGEY